MPFSRSLGDVVKVSLRRRRWLPHETLARRTRGPVLGGIRLRLVTRWRARELDRQIASGADPLESDELSLRVGQLGSPGTRLRLAAGLRRAAQFAKGTWAPLITTRMRRKAIRESDELLLAVAERLRDGGPLGVQGLAMTARLFNDPSSPLYVEHPRRPLTVAARETLAALDRGLRTACTSRG